MKIKMGLLLLFVFLLCGLTPGTQGLDTSDMDTKHESNGSANGLICYGCKDPLLSTECMELEVSLATRVKNTAPFSKTSFLVDHAYCDACVKGRVFEGDKKAIFRGCYTKDGLVVGRDGRKIISNLPKLSLNFGNEKGYWYSGRCPIISKNDSFEYCIEFNLCATNYCNSFKSDPELPVTLSEAPQIPQESDAIYVVVFTVGIIILAIVAIGVFIFFKKRYSSVNSTSQQISMF